MDQILSQIVGNVCLDIGLPPNTGTFVPSKPNSTSAFQCNGFLKKDCKPYANTVVEILKTKPEFSKVELVGNGYINLDVTDAFLCHILMSMNDSTDFGIEKHTGTVILDYGGPNIAKPMHVGHLRSSIIGDTLRRIYNFAGYKTISDVHLGDWGTQMGQIISELQIRHPDWIYFDEKITEGYSEESPVTLEDLEEIYPTASKACKDNEDRLKLAKDATVELQNGRPGYRALWQHFINISVKSIKENFDSLNVHFDLWNGESTVHHRINDMIERLKSKGLVTESDGALIIDVSEADTGKIPPLILLKSDGAAMYSTTDLATIDERLEVIDLCKIVYVTDKRQSLHFDQVFRVARQGIIGDMQSFRSSPKGVVGKQIDLIHAGFGTMNGLDGKPLKTRQGGVLKLSDLIETGIEKAKTHMEEFNLGKDMNDDEKNMVARKVAIAAIKFADLQNSRIADYTFDINRLTSFHGRTGPYLLYQIVRIKSLLSKAENENDNLKNINVSILKEEGDRKLALLLTEFPNHFKVALNDNTPHVLCCYAYRLAQEFSGFYVACHILSEKDNEVKISRISLCKLILKQLELIFELLGIDVPDRM